MFTRMSGKNKPNPGLMGKIAVSLAALALLVPALAFAQPDAQDASPSGTTTAQQEQKAQDEVYDLITKYHVSGVTPDNFKETDIPDMLKNLDDPYTQYFTDSEWNSFVDELENQYVGIGISFGQDDHGFYVNEVFADSPAYGAGLQSGDYIVAVEGKSVEGQTSDEIVNQIKGPEGTTVHVTIERQGEMLEKTMQRAAITVPVLEAHWFPNHIGYVRLTDFSSDADEKLAAQLEQWKKDGLKSLILDLRDNPGGRLDTAQNIAAQFIENGILIHAKDRDGQDQTLPITDGRTLGAPIYVLVNENSASAAEILTGAIQDYHKGLVIGTKTFGKGSVQTTMEIAAGGVLKLTIDEYYTSLGRKVNKVGLQPDIHVEGSVNQLIDALYQAGNGKIQIDLGSRQTKFNGVPFDYAIKTIDWHGETYVPTRILSTLIKGTIAWDNKLKTATVRTLKDSASFSAASGGLKIMDANSYVSLNDFQQSFPEFSWTASGGDLILSTN